MMTKTRIIILFGMMLFIFQSKKSIAQEDTTIIMNLDANNTPSFQLTGASYDRYIWFFGDGHYSFASSPKHNFADNGHTINRITLYHMDRYKPLPPKRVSTFDANDLGNPYANPDYYTYSSNPIAVDVSTMWEPVNGTEVIYTTLITNNTASSIEGELDFIIPTDLLAIPAEMFSTDINNEDWLQLKGIDYDAVSNTARISFNVNAFASGKQRLLHLRFDVIDTGGNEYIHTEAKFNVKGSGIERGTLAKRKKGHPHDPNYKLTDEKAICNNTTVNQEIECEIHFQNEGNEFAELIEIHDLYSEIDVIDSFSVVSSSLELSDAYLIDDKIFFEFDEVLLPGSSQNYPFQYTFEQSRGYVKFVLFTKRCLYRFGEDRLESHAEIEFNNQEPINTDTVGTDIADLCFDLPSCPSLPDAFADWFTENPGFEGGDLEIGASPNPHMDVLNLTVAGKSLASEAIITIFDAQGRQIDQLTRNILPNHINFIQLNTSTWIPGIHLILVQHGTNSEMIQCVKQN